MALPVRKSYKGAPVTTTLSVPLSVSSTSCTVGSVTGWPTTFPFYIVIGPGTVKEEKLKVTAASGTVLTVVRAQDDTAASTGGAGFEHAAASTVYPVFTALEADEANQIASAMTTKGDLVTTNGSTINRLAVGATNTHVLQVDSTATNGIKWGQVATAGIADSAITSAKILDGTIVTDDLADNAVTSAKIADGTIVDADINATAAISLSKLATGALPTAITIASANIVNGTISDVDIANGAVTNSKIAGATGSWTPVRQNGTFSSSGGDYYMVGQIMYFYMWGILSSSVSQTFYVTLPSGTYSSEIYDVSGYYQRGSTYYNIKAPVTSNGYVGVYINNGSYGSFTDLLNHPINSPYQGVGDTVVWRGWVRKTA